MMASMYLKFGLDRNKLRVSEFLLGINRGTKLSFRPKRALQIPNILCDELRMVGNLLPLNHTCAIRFRINCLLQLFVGTRHCQDCEAKWFKGKGLHSDC